MGKAERQTQVVKLRMCACGVVTLCLSSAVEMYLERQGWPVNDELSQLKRRIERTERTWKEKRRGGEVEERGGKVVRRGEAGRKESGDIRELWEVVESLSVPSDLLEMEENLSNIADSQISMTYIAIYTQSVQIIPQLQ